MNITAYYSEILSSFGQKIGIPDIQFDDDGQCILKFDDVTVNLELNQDATQIIVSSPLTSLSEQPNEALMLRYLALNYIALIHGTGGIGFDEGTRQLMFVERIPLLGLDDDRFEAIMTYTVDRVEALQAMLSSPEWSYDINSTLDIPALMPLFISSKF